MTNPFASAAPAATEEAPTAKPAKKAVSAKVDATKADAPANLGLSVGDPFAAPRGIGDGERITDFVDNLLLVKPTEFIAQMGTKQGPSDTVRADMAVLDDEEEPGKIIIGVLLFQQALRREARAILDGRAAGGPPYLLGRLRKGKTSANNTIYTFEEANAEEIQLARDFLTARPGAL